MTTPTPAPAPQPAPAGDFPGKTLGIVGLILAFVFSLAGLIVSIIANNQSKAAGYKNGLAKAGIILSIVFLVIGVIVTIIWVSVGASVIGGVIDMCAELGEGSWDVEGVQYDCG